MTWEDFRFDKELLGLENDAPPARKESRKKGSLSDGEKDDKKADLPLPDGPKGLEKKLKEQNFNIRVAQHLSEA